MKSIAVFLLFINFFLIHSVSAQTERGSKIIGLNSMRLGGLFTSNSKIDRNISVDIAPNYGFFLNPRVALGAGLLTHFDFYQKYRQKIDVTGMVGLQPMLRVYVSKEWPFRFFIPLNLLCAYDKSNVLQSGVIQKVERFVFRPSLGVGYTYYISKSFGVEATLMYYENFGKTKKSNFGPDGVRNVSLNFGLQYYIKRGW